MQIIENLYKLIGSIICHQLPSRTLEVGGRLLPLCARDTGIYTGVFLSAVYLASRRRLRSNMTPDLRISILLCILMLPMLADGISSYQGVRETNNTIRLFTGAFFGICLPFLLVPAAHFNPHGINTDKSLRKLSELAAICGAGFLICIMILKYNSIPWILLSAIITVSPVVVIGYIIYVIFSRMKVINFRNKYYLLPGITLLVLTSMYMFSRLILSLLRTIY